MHQRGQPCQPHQRNGAAEGGFGCFRSLTPALTAGGMGAPERPGPAGNELAELDRIVPPPAGPA